MLVLLGCEGSISPTAPDETLVAQQPATGVGVTTGTSNIVARGAAQEFMLRARGETSGPFAVGPLTGTAWVHVTGRPETAAVVVTTIGDLGPGGLPTSPLFDFGSGDAFTTEELGDLVPPFTGPGEYAIVSAPTIVSGTGAFANMTGDLKVTKSTFTVSVDWWVTTEWHMKGRVQLGD
jgi:hypothetical protein